MPLHQMFIGVPDIRSAKSGGWLQGKYSINRRQLRSHLPIQRPLIALAMELLSPTHKVDVAGVDIGAHHSPSYQAWF